jgi:hypothetical protein
MSSMAEAPSPRPSAPRRPFALVVLAGLMVLKAALLFLVFFDVRLMGAGSITGDLIGDDRITTVVAVVMAAALVVSAIGVLALRRSGWLLAMVLTGMFIAADIYAFLYGTPTYLWMGLNIVTVFYLNQPDARAAVGVAVADDRKAVDE